jgi:Glycosyltransferase 61
MRIELHALSPQWITDRCGEARDIVLPPRYGEGAALKVTTVDDILYLPHIANVQSLPMTREGIVPNESVGDWNLDYIRRVFKGPNAPYDGEFDADRSPLNVCILGNVFSKVFGHWTEEMIKVSLLESVGFDGYYVVCDMPRFAHEFLHLAGIDAERILDVRTPTIFKTAVFPTRVDHANIDRHHNVLFLLRERLFSRIDPEPSRYGDKIWRDRGAMVANAGFLLNREEICAGLARYGIVAVDMAKLPVSEQLRAARDMRLACGVHGSQFVHVQFMPVRSSVVECFSPRHVNPSVIEICRALSHEYHQIVAVHTDAVPYLHGRNTIVNRNHLDLVLRNLMSQRPRLSPTVVAASEAQPGEAPALIVATLENGFRPEGENGWLAALPPELEPLTDSPEAPLRSPLLLFEDGRELDPGHALHDAIRHCGAGRYSFWKGEFHFSTSDNSDPNRNGRTYSVARRSG